MKIVSGIAASLVAMSILVAAPASAGEMGQSEKLRRLDIMLMVTGLRCRKTADDFQPEYGQFTTNHIAELNAAARAIKADYAAHYGPAGADRALDKISVQMANEFGNGHPWLNCAQLKQVAGSLAQMDGAEPLFAAADDLLSNGSHQLAWMH